MQVKGIKRQIGWLYVFPAILILLTFLIIPFLMSFSYSFTNYNILTPWAKQYVGFTNYINTFKDPLFTKFKKYCTIRYLYYADSGWCGFRFSFNC